MTQALDLAGTRFARLTVLRPGPPYGPWNRTTWLCRCDCGTEATVPTSDLRTGNTRSCGCLAREQLAARKRTHGYALKGRRQRLYRVWQNMKQRCSDPNWPGYHRYGGRGVTVCDEWQGFEGFRDWAEANGYADHLSIDRIDNDGHYTPENCRWATPTQQARNKCNNRLVTHAGRTATLAEWSDITGITQRTINIRLDRLGWPVSKALTTPTRSMRAAAKENRNDAGR